MLPNNPPPPEPAEDQQAMQKETQLSKAAATAQTAQPMCAPDTAGQKHTFPEARGTKKRTELSTQRRRTAGGDEVTLT